ncbi:uncharacterized protein M421DRAFT_256248 [Didymella exigua CBS 183.55]|uniref:Uncharacterized protein n=1 Tax=Didymella exigua CBS 183.55 TaxID=1150837 RepID=A0A6A5RXC2_9PLEO|nr:uncharacterized protein M421DRAFT_256248 [Didymella exigua CBS 183.55]KAF1933051.1 hypothetical protein M421DRAFT_256248 [Didymella exigua CBS 183.55]
MITAIVTEHMKSRVGSHENYHTSVGPRRGEKGERKKHHRTASNCILRATIWSPAHKWHSHRRRLEHDTIRYMMQEIIWKHKTRCACLSATKDEAIFSCCTIHIHSTCIAARQSTRCFVSDFDDISKSMTFVTLYTTAPTTKTCPPTTWMAPNYTGGVSGDSAKRRRPNHFDRNHTF